MSDTPRTDAHTVDGPYRLWDGSVTTLQSWDYVPAKNGDGEVVQAKFARVLERELATVTSERDRLRRAAEIGLEYAKDELGRRKESFAGYPTCWVEQQRDVAFIDAALRGEGEP
jgi:hypothetical protein